MSHFAVMVLTRGKKTVEELLAPYDENISVEPYVYRTKAQIIENAKTTKKNILKRIEEKKNEGVEYKTNEWEDKLIYANTDQEFYEAATYDDTTYDEDGNELSTYNPKSKWDWYSIGGRWQGLLKAKRGVKAHSPGVFGSPPHAEDENRFDCAFIKDLDFTPDEEEMKRAARWWEVAIEDSPLKPGESEDDFRTFYKKEYYLERYKDKETYVKIITSFGTFAVITPDGEWHEKGEMGWFGCSSETGDESLKWDLEFKERFIDSMPDDTVVTIVDCHI